MADLTPSPFKARPGKLSASVSGLVRIEGLLECLAEITDSPARALKTKAAFLESCQRVVGLKGPKGPEPVLVAVKDGRKTVRHRVESMDSAVAIARGAIRRETMDVTVKGPIAGRIGKACGLKPFRVRAWARDPVEAARREAIAEAMYRRWGVRCVVPTNPEATWCAALVGPLSKIGNGAYEPAGRFALVADREARVRLLRWPKGRKAVTPDNVEEAILEGVPVGRSSDIGIATRPDMNDIHEYAGVEDRRSVGNSTWYRIDYVLSRMSTNATTQFRRALPEPVRDHVGLLPITFDRVHDVLATFDRRKDWTILHYERCNQAIRAMPWLRDALAGDAKDLPALARAIVEGAPLERVVRVAMGKFVAVPDIPLHPKTLRSLSGFWHRQRGRIARGGPTSHRASMVSQAVAGLDIAMRANPHLPCLSNRDVATFLQNLEKVERKLEPYAIARFLLACRDRNGKVADMDRGVGDTIRWVYHECLALADALPGITQEEASIVGLRAATEFLFPDRRTLKGLGEVSNAWHGGFNPFLQRISAIKTRARLDASSKMPPGLLDHVFPHFLSSPVDVDGVHLRALTDARSLEIEGAEMRHCVGSYAEGAMAGRSMIVALSSPYGRSTADVRLADEGLTVSQHYGPRNDPCHPVHESSLAKAMKALGRDQIRDLGKRIEEADRASRAMQQALRNAVTPEWQSRIDDETFEYLRRIAKGPHRKVDRLAWLSDVASRAGVVQILGPRD